MSERICLLRLSALGDVTHVASVVAAIHRQRPEAQLSWVIGRTEAQLLDGLQGVELVVYDKREGIAGWRTLRAKLADRRYDALLQLGVSLRNNLVSTAIRARRRIGFDRARSGDLHGLFINERIPAATGQHVIDAMHSFLPLIDVAIEPPRWALPIPQVARDAVDALVGRPPRLLLISPCSSHPLRDWHASGYAAAAAHAVRAHHCTVALIGGRSGRERAMAEQIKAEAGVDLLDLVGKDTLKQALALLERAALLISPDSGPVHMANALGTPVLGLYAATNPKRSGPYHSLHWCVDRYDAAAQMLHGRPADTLRWGTRLEAPGVMDLIETDAVCAQLDAFFAARQLRSPAAG